jgi:hypothetical protein
MKKYTNKILAGLYGLGVVMIVVTLLIVRYRLDMVVELNV